MRPPRLPMSVPRSGTACSVPSGAQRFCSGDGLDMGARLLLHWRAEPEQRMEIVEWSSPNFGPRRDGLLPELVVLHHTAMTSAEAALERLLDPASEVSAHYLIGED